MIYLISNEEKFIPKKYCKTTNILTTKEFIDIASSDEGLSIAQDDEFLVDISELTKDLYDALRLYSSFKFKIKYFYIEDTKLPDFFIFEKVEIVKNKNCKIVKDKDRLIFELK